MKPDFSTLNNSFVPNTKEWGWTAWIAIAQKTVCQDCSTVFKSSIFSHRDGK
jgi:hypothetical protein